MSAPTEPSTEPAFHYRPAPLCINCVYHDMVEQHHVCTQATSLVDGSVQVADCSTRRAPNFYLFCGPNGTYFKPKESRTPSPFDLDGADDSL